MSRLDARLTTGQGRGEVHRKVLTYYQVEAVVGGPLFGTRHSTSVAAAQTDWQEIRIGSYYSSIPIN